MDGFPEQLVAEAFALSRARGADLLVRLGDFDQWRGDLAEMRGDSPRTSGPSPVREPANSDALTDALLMARAIELLQPTCREALAEGAGNADVPDCRKRLLEIYARLRGSHEAATPDWVAEREHAGVGSNGRRGK